MTELKVQRCPVCNKIGNMRFDSGGERYFVACENAECGLIGPYRKTKLRAAGAWNKLIFGKRRWAWRKHK